MSSTIREDQDTDFTPPEQRLALQTSLQATTTLETSCRITDKFCNVWQNEYPTSLREKHILNRGPKGCQQHLRIGAVVLICEATLPRHCWKMKMGVIQELSSNVQGVIREAVVR
ncbi:hypothetical protein GCK32_022910 [Trichostrongylus colubriformis]|uniref:DUF5641 domain-containing protein n=1 Tax=Trichostrongylus colubriformis TaxID=6319 RepID=A0AAN8FGH5_TRICO